ncbi:hypothetical protein C0995_005086 [Termitomyces sp. Mi166|nr:hypothetical protein C0995_005086 [Termitomyces sp. Mi166\
MADSSTPIVSATISPSNSHPSPTPDTEDDYNTAEARIHFGPLKSPEKRIAAIVTRRHSLYPVVHNSPLRRSPRLSTPLPQSPLRENRQDPLQEEMIAMNVVEEDQEAVDVPPPRAGTPDVEQTLQDEPPSALAIKISRAYDNPSPPPSPPIDLELAPCLVSSSSQPFLLPFLTASFLDSTKNVSNTEDATPSTPSNVTMGSLKNSSPVPPIASTGRKTSPPDLISFESFSSPAPVFRAMSPSTPAPQPSHSSDQPNVDDQASLPLNFFGSPKAGEEQVSTSIPLLAVSESHGENETGEAEDIKNIAQDHHEEQSVLRFPLVSADEGTREKPQPYWTSIVLHSSRPRHSVSRYQDYDQLITRLPQAQQASIDKTHPQSIPHQSEEDGGAIVEVKNRGTQEDQDNGSPPKSIFLRELGSLSPTANDLLSSLVIPSRRSSLSLTIPPTKEATSSTRLPFPRSSTLPALPQTPRRSTSPIRFASPSRSMARESNNTQLQAISFDNSVCTPARRIPIESAIAQGHISPSKGSQLLTSTSRVALDGLHKPFLTILPTDSPARRVLAPPEVTMPTVPKKWQGIRFGSPTRVSSKERSSSVEPVAYGASKGKSRERGESVPPATSLSLLRPSSSGPSSSREMLKPAKLPFPLVLSIKDIPPAIPECQAAGDLTTSSTKPSQAIYSSPSKSTLKQTTSRIPTRTVKPYAKRHSKLDVDKGKSAPRVIMSTTDSSKSEAFSSRTLRTCRTDGKAETPPITDKPETLPISLKRKRAIVEVPSPVKPRAAVTLRQVPRVLAPNIVSNPEARALSSTSVLKKIPQQIRRVFDKPLDVTTNPPPVKPISPTVASTLSLGIVPQRMGASIPEIEIDGVKSDEKGISVPEESSGDKTSALVEPIDIPAPPEPAIPNGVRRTTRTRKVLNPSLISDGLVSADMKPRRKPSAQTNAQGPGDITYSGMSATALRALTTSNTARNQRYLAAKLETEIIRKEGDRPESPAVKMKTVLQREQEERNRQRKERAAKRGRPGGERLGHLNEDRHSDRDTENESDWDDRSFSPSPKRHKRGPGDEEEYKTPVRKLKRLKLVDDDDKEESVENERRVKWDRGLFTTISLDQVKLGTRRPPKENIAIKGCLAPAAKTLPLDNLGNLHADTPLTDLVEENILVKRFVYDNDVEAVEEVVVKNTRARSKKGKS